MNRPSHPAELLSEFIGEDKLIDVKKASLLLKCHQRTLEKVLNFDPSKEQNRGISQELGWKMAKVFNTDKEFWNDLQKSYDLWQEVSKNEIEPVMKFDEDDLDFIKLVTRFHKKNEEAPHPAKIVQQLVGEDKKYTITEAGLMTGIPRKTLSDFLQYDDYKNDNVSLSSKMAVKLGQSFQMDPKEWVQMQIDYNEKHSNIEQDIGKNLLTYLKEMEKRTLDIPDVDSNAEEVLNKQKDDAGIENFVQKKSTRARKPK